MKRGAAASDQGNLLHSCEVIYHLSRIILKFAVFVRVGLYCIEGQNMKREKSFQIMKMDIL